MQNKKKDRGMIKWQPFASLPEHMEYIDKMIKNKKVVKNRISNDKLEEINDLVEKSIKNSTNLVLIVYKNDGYIKKNGIPKYYDEINHELIILNDNKRKERIKIKDIVDAVEN